MTTVSQRTFAGGELAPSLYARVDNAKYQTGLRTCRNMLVMRHGGVQNRPGTEFVAEVKDSTKVVRMIPFVFNSDQTYVLEFGDLYMRVHRYGAQVVETAKTITGVTKANPGVVTSAAHGYSNGQEIYISGVGGMRELNGRNYFVDGATTNTFTLTYKDGTPVNTTAFTTFTTGGSTYRIYEIVTPYNELDLATLNYVQSADVITIVHPHTPRANSAGSGMRTGRWERLRSLLKSGRLSRFRSR